MKKILFFLTTICFLLSDCKDKKSEQVKMDVSDTAESYSQPRALSATPPIITEGKDTIYFITKDTTVSKSQTVTVTTTYPITRTELHPYQVPPVQPPATNKLPIAKAGNDVSINAAYVILDGSTSTDPDGTVVGFQWIKVLGPSTYNIDNPNSARCGFSNLVNGVYTFRLTVTDNKAATATDDVNVTVGAVTPPIPVDTTQPPVGSVKYLQLPVGVVRTYSGVSNLVIEGLRFGNKNAAVQGGNTLQFSGCSNITVRNCYFSSSAGAAVAISGGSSNIKFENCLFAYNRVAVHVSKSSGVYLKNCQQVNGYGSGMGDGRDGGLLKLVECVGAGFGVENCRVQSFNGESNVEDIISIFASSGTASSPINITGNIFVGGGPSKSGGGIVAGDGTNQFTGGWMNITNNTLLNVGNYGIGIAGGSNVTVTGNKIYSDQLPWSNNGLFIWNQYAPACANITIKNNRVNWTCGNPANCTPGQQNHGWNGGGCTNIIFEKATTITKSEMNVPDHLITFVTPAELLTIRASK